MIVADRMGLMHEGQLMQVASPPEIYERPNSRWVADFIGEVTMIEGRVAADRAMESSLGRLDISSGSDARINESVWLALRPEKIRMSGDRPIDEANALAGTVHEIGYRGDVSIYKIRLADRSLMKVALPNASVQKKPLFAVNDLVWLSWPAEAGVVLTR